MDEHLNPSEAASHSAGASRDTMERIRKVFVESARLKVRAQELPFEQMLEEVAILDSIAVLEFVTAMEREFGVSLEPEFLEFDFLRDLSRLASYIEGRMAARPGSKTLGVSA
jgi:acyl carrier protein